MMTAYLPVLLLCHQIVFNLEVPAGSSLLDHQEKISRAYKVPGHQCGTLISLVAEIMY